MMSFKAYTIFWGFRVKEAFTNLSPFLSIPVPTKLTSSSIYVLLPPFDCQVDSPNTSASFAFRTTTLYWILSSIKFHLPLESGNIQTTSLTEKQTPLKVTILSTIRAINIRQLAYQVIWTLWQFLQYLYYVVLHTKDILNYWIISSLP